MGKLVVCAVIFALSVAFLSPAFGGVADKMENDFFDNPEITLQLSHYFGTQAPSSDSSYTPRGSVVIRSFKGPRFTATQNELTDDDLNQLQKLVASDGYYFIKATVTGSEDKTFKGFARAVSVLQSGLSDILRVHLSPSGDILAISYALARSDFLTGSRKAQPHKFNTTLLVHHGEIGPQPDTAPYLEKLEQERLAKERGEDPRDNRSFIAKYWMYIVPIAIMVLLSGASNPEEGGGGGR